MRRCFDDAAFDAAYCHDYYFAAAAFADADAALLLCRF